MATLYTVVLDTNVTYPLLEPSQDGYTLRQVGTVHRSGTVTVTLDGEAVHALARRALRNKSGHSRDGGIVAKVNRKTILEKKVRHA